ncbi:MAG: DNA polymerase III subunit gamma/tau [Enterobacteriaceae bacterium PSpicST1]|nr:MAG: DNA polymerase III subunit gamma/tau [Enterobacteriaceae bacterium PSpicST1]
MNHQVLARKWRPKFFKDVIGQEHVLISLINSFLLKRIHHAYIFYGIRGVGKTTIARLIAKCLNCINGISYNPCGYCINCKQIDNNTFIDLIEIDAASKTKVEDTRDLLNNIHYTPIQGRFKIYIIDEFHMLSRNSFNALLKTLEEPPKHIKFLLATTNINKIPETILSRCFKLYFKTIEKKKIYYQLKKILKFEKIKFDSNSLKIISYISNGSMRDALTLTDQAIVIGNGIIEFNKVNNMLGFFDNKYSIYILELLIFNNSVEIMKIISKLSSFNIDWDYLLIEILTLLHNISMIKLLKNKNVDDKYINIKYRLYKLSKILTQKNIQLYYKIFINGRKELIYSPNKKIGVEITLLRALLIINKNISKKKPQLFLSFKKRFFFLKKIIKNICKKNLNKINFNLNENKIKKLSINIKSFNKYNSLINIINFNIKKTLFNNIINNYFYNKFYNNIYNKYKKKINYILFETKKKIEFLVLNFKYIDKKKILYYIKKNNEEIENVFKNLNNKEILKFNILNNNYINYKNKIYKKKYLLLFNKIKEDKNIKKLKFLFNIKI